MAKRIPIEKLSEFEKEALKIQILEELGYLDEIIEDLDEESLYILESIGENKDPVDALEKRKLELQLKNARSIKKRLTSELKHLEVGEYLNKVVLDLNEMDALQNVLQKRRITKIDPKSVQTNLSNVENRIQNVMEQFLIENEGNEHQAVILPITEDEEIALKEVFEKKTPKKKK